jgi:hypothetical protein
LRTGIKTQAQKGQTLQVTAPLRIAAVKSKKLFFFNSALDFFQNKRLVINSYLNFYLEKYIRL